MFTSKINFVTQSRARETDVSWHDSGFDNSFVNMIVYRLIIEVTWTHEFRWVRKTFIAVWSTLEGKSLFQEQYLMTIARVIPNLFTLILSLFTPILSLCSHLF